jgi:DNA (cytosine-5)-methyltransferase 1
MKHFDLFSGYGGFTIALNNIYGISNEVEQRRCGQEKDELETSLPLPSSQSNERQSAATIGFSEIDKYASAVLKYHWPNTKNYGDISKINWSEVPDFDLLTGGSPCQDLSIAGKRKGLEGARSGLFYEYLRAVKEKKPKYFIWENVKGALSSRSGWDFAAVINEMAEAGYSLWWQVLNAKDFGVPQNRERIFVVGFRDRPAPEVFFEREDGERTY